MDYLDPETNEKFIPYIIESTYGLDRTVLALLCEAYDEEVIDAEKNDTRVVLHLSPVVAPYKAAVLPLSKKLSEEAIKICDDLSRKFMVDSTRPAPSASVIAARTRSVLRCASPMTSTPSRITA